MQTFLPYPDFIHTAKILDDKRLGKQRIEALQILKTLHYGGHWKNHPAVRMWKGYEDALGMYMNVMIIEWEFRKFNNTMLYYIARATLLIYPPWLGDERLHMSHKANLARKSPDYYGKLWPEADVDAPYWWPVDLINKTKDKKMKEYWKNAIC